MSRSGPKTFGQGWAAAGVALAFTLLVASYRVEADPWKTRFNSQYAETLLPEHGQSGPDYGNAIYTGNLILSQAALKKNDIASAKRYLLEAAATPGSGMIERNGLDTSVARIVLERGEHDTVLEYFNRGSKPLAPRRESHQPLGSHHPRRPPAELQ